MSPVLLPSSASVRLAATLLASVGSFLALSAAPVGATTIDFEDLGANLPLTNFHDASSEAFYNGHSGEHDGDPNDSTDFASQGATFTNHWDEFGTTCCNTGWSYSQMQDTTTPGFTNQYSAFAGSGAGGSDTYGVAFTASALGGGQLPVAKLTLDGPRQVYGAWFTNTTYAALSMRDGDGFAKKFGGEDGQDEDFFILTVYGLDAADQVTGSVEVVLADFRGSKTFIADDWFYRNLGTLGVVSGLAFELSSSDVDAEGGFLNTPSYFAMDDFAFVPEPTSGALLAFGLALLARRRR